MTVKKRNPADDTRRNRIATRKMIAAAESRLMKVIGKLNTRISKLEKAKR